MLEVYRCKEAYSAEIKCLVNISSWSHHIIIYVRAF